MSQQGYDINNLLQEAQKRWLKPPEVFFILQNHEKYEITPKAPQKPPGGSLYLFNKRVLRFFRKDGHNWRKKKDGRTVGEAHERLKVGNAEALNCYYAHGEENPNFQRRSYWMLDPAYEHIVLVHYREISEGKSTNESVTESPSTVFTPSPSSFTAQIQGSISIVSNPQEPYHISSSPRTVEVSSEVAFDSNGFESKEIGSETNVSQFFRELEEQLSLNEDSIKDFDPLCVQQGATDDPNVLAYGCQNSKQDQSANLLYEPGFSVDPQYFDAAVELQMQTNNLTSLLDAGHSGAYGPSYQQDCPNQVVNTISWTEDLDSRKASSAYEYQEKLQSSISKQPTMYDDHSHMSKISDSNYGNSTMLLTLEAQTFELPACSPVRGPQDMNSDYYAFSYGQGQIDWPIELDSSLTVAQQQQFTIREISPEWGYATEATKIIIVGSFLCDPKASAWRCMFGEIEVPLEIIQEGVIRVEAPSHLPGKVTLCITSGNHGACSNIREFEYRTKDSGSSQSGSFEGETIKSPEELLLLVRFCQLLMSGSSQQQGNHSETGNPILRELKGEDDLWAHVIESLLVGNGTQSAIVDWVLQQLIKDKLYQWASSKSKDKQDHSDCLLSKKEQGIIHMVAGLGFEWALNPILALGISINFRDINGWTALHWAARFGREKMVAALLASGALPGAVTDPSSQDPVGQTPAAIAASNGHKGLAGYLSEKALTSHLMSLTLEESELSKDSAEIEAERTVEIISNTMFVPNEDQASLEEYLTAVRNAAQAAARIQAAFRAHSFRKRQQMERASAAVDKYGLNTNDIQGLSAMSKLTFRNARAYNSAALCIQKRYRGYKGRKGFLALRQKVVRIQAHVRGYQVRKQYKVICWAVGVIDKVVLRWKRKGDGLRGFLNELEPIDESDNEDIIKVFRKEKVGGAINLAVSRVFSMVDPPEARQQYHRMLEHYQQAKVEIGEQSKPPSTSGAMTDMENEENYVFQWN